MALITRLQPCFALVAPSDDRLTHRPIDVMRRTISLFIITACLVSLCVGIAMGQLWHFRAEFASTLTARFLSPNKAVLAKRRPDVIQRYKEFDEGPPLKLHVFYPESESDKHQKTIVFFHGGGWTTGQAGIFYPHCTQLATKGIECISADYRTAGSHSTSPMHAVEDAKDAYRYVVENAQQLGLRGEQLYVAGASAGGHIAASIATADYLEHNLERAYPDGVILLGPVIDNSQNGYGFERVKFFGARFSPLHNLDNLFPRTLFLVGENDRFIPTDTAREFVKRLNALGVDATLAIYPEAFHSFYLDKQFDETMQDIEQFLLNKAGD